VTASLVAATLGDAAAVMIADAGSAADAVIGKLRATRANERDSVLLLISGDVSVLDRAMLRAAIGPLAVELAPEKRLNALDIAGDAALDDVIAAARFLSAAESTTGQVLEIR
jgi:hypothetical protein